MFELPFGTFSKGDKIQVTYIPGFFKLGTGIQKRVTLEGTLERVRNFQGKQYLTLTAEGKTIELRGDDLQNVAKVKTAPTPGKNK